MQIIPYSTKYQSELLLFLKKNNHAVIGHLPQWHTVMKKTFNYNNFSLIAIKQGEIIGYFPLFLIKNIFLKKFLISIPFNNFSGILYSENKDIYEIFLGEAKKIAIQKKIEYVEIRQLNYNPLQLPTRENFVSMFLDLTPDIDEIWNKSLNTKVRNQVRKAEKNNMKIIENDNVENFYKVYAQNMRDLGSPVFSILFFKTILNEFNNYAEIISVQFKNKIIASMFVIKWENYFSDPWASSLKEYNYLNPNNLLYWHAIKKAKNENFKIFDMGRSTLDTGTYHFKKQWGAIPQKLDYKYVFNLETKIPIVDAKNNKYDKIIQIWKKLPIFVANFLGKKIIKYLPEL